MSLDQLANGQELSSPSCPPGPPQGHGWQQPVSPHFVPYGPGPEMGPGMGPPGPMPGPQFTPCMQPQFPVQQDQPQYLPQGCPPQGGQYPQAAGFSLPADLPRYLPTVGPGPSPPGHHPPAEPGWFGGQPQAPCPVPAEGQQHVIHPLPQVPVPMNPGAAPQHPQPPQQQGGPGLLPPPQPMQQPGGMMQQPGMMPQPMQGPMQPMPGVPPMSPMHQGFDGGMGFDGMQPMGPGGFDPSMHAPMSGPPMMQGYASPMGSQLQSPEFSQQSPESSQPMTPQHDQGHPYLQSPEWAGFAAPFPPGQWNQALAPPAMPLSEHSAMPAQPGPAEEKRPDSTAASARSTQLDESEADRASEPESPVSPLSEALARPSPVLLEKLAATPPARLARALHARSGDAQSAHAVVEIVAAVNQRLGHDALAQAVLQCCMEELPLIGSVDAPEGALGAVHLVAALVAHGLLALPVLKEAFRVLVFARSPPPEEQVTAACVLLQHAGPGLDYGVGAKMAELIVLRLQELCATASPATRQAIADAVSRRSRPLPGPPAKQRTAVEDLQNDAAAANRPFLLPPPA